MIRVVKKGMILRPHSPGLGPPALMRVDEILKVDMEEGRFYAHASHLNYPDLSVRICRPTQEYVFDFDGDWEPAVFTMEMPDV